MLGISAMLFFLWGNYYRLRKKHYRLRKMGLQKNKTDYSKSCPDNT